MKLVPPANDTTGVAAKIVAAAKTIDPEDHEEVHFLLVGAARDLAACAAPAVASHW